MKSKYLAAMMAGMMLAGTPVYAAETTQLSTENTGDSEKNFDFVMSNPLLTVNKGQSTALSVKTSDKYGGAFIRWKSSDTSVATVDAYGNVTGVKDGHAVITAYTADGMEVTSQVTVVTPVTSVTMINDDMTMNKGEAFQLAAKVFPNDATDNSLTWYSSATDIASVDADGTVHALKSGKAVITARAANGYSDSITVTVVTPEESIQLDTTAILLTLDRNGDAPTKMLTAKVGPEDADHKEVTWTTSSRQVATVSDDGTVTGVGVGEAIITATTSNGKSASCRVTVGSKKYPVTAITLNQTSGEGYVGGSEKLAVSSFTPEYAEDKSVTWSTSDASVVSVDKFGTVKFLKEGKATVTAKSVNGPSASCTYTVKVRHADTVTLKGKETVLKGKTAKYKATVGPDDATYKTVKFKTSDKKIATINSKGVLTAKKAGTVTVTAYAAHDTDVKAEMQVTVKKVNLKKAKAKNSKITLKKGKTKSLLSNVKLTPSNATEKNFKWSTSNRKVVKIFGSKMKALRKGKAVITGKVKLSKNKTATVKYTVTVK